MLSRLIGSDFLFPIKRQKYNSKLQFFLTAHILRRIHLKWMQKKNHKIELISTSANQKARRINNGMTFKIISSNFWVFSHDFQFWKPVWFLMRKYRLSRSRLGVSNTGFFFRSPVAHAKSVIVNLPNKRHLITWMKRGQLSGPGLLSNGVKLPLLISAGAPSGAFERFCVAEGFNLCRAMIYSFFLDSRLFYFLFSALEYSLPGRHSDSFFCPKIAIKVNFHIPKIKIQFYRVCSDPRNPGKKNQNDKVEYRSDSPKTFFPPSCMGNLISSSSARFPGKKDATVSSFQI